MNKRPSQFGGGTIYAQEQEINDKSRYASKHKNIDLHEVQLPRAISRLSINLKEEADKMKIIN